MRKEIKELKEMSKEERYSYRRDLEFNNLKEENRVDLENINSIVLDIIDRIEGDNKYKIGEVNRRLNSLLKIIYLLSK